MIAERDHRQAQASGPTFGALVQGARPSVRQADPGCSKQFARLALAEPQIAGPDLSDLPGKPELVQPDRRIPARRQYDAPRARQDREQILELCNGVSRPQLVEIVDDHHDRLELLGQLRQDRVDRLVAVERHVRRRLRLILDRGRGAADRAQDGGPESLRILLVAVHGHERDATKVGRAVRPCTQ